MRLDVRLILLTFAVILSCSVLMSAMGFRQFERSIEPAVIAKVDALAKSIETEIVTALDYGIPFENLEGVGEFFDVLNQAHPEIYGIRFYGGASGMQFSSKGYAQEAESREGLVQNDYPLIYQGKAISHLEFLVDAKFAEKKSLELLLDVITVIAVSVIIAFELVVFILSFNVTARLQRMRIALEAFFTHRQLQLISDEYADELGVLASRINQRWKEVAANCRWTMQGMTTSVAQRVDFIRWPFFLLIFSESLSLSFFPLYVGQLDIPDWGLAKEFVVGLPISIFMFIWAISLPAGGVWSDTVGRRRAFVFGAVLTAVGLVLTSFAYSLFDLLIWRSITAVGYSVVFITVQGFVTDHTDASNRNKGMATFVATFFAGSLSGAAIGGILADHIGMQWIFMLSALLSLGAALFVARFIVAGGGQPRHKLTFASIRDVCTDRSFLMVTLFSAIPSKVALTGFLYFSAPIFLNNLEVSKSTTGRVIMLYGLMIICVSPFIAHYADRLKSRLPLVLSGGTLGAVAIAELACVPSLTGVLISISLLGVAHAISVPSQLTFITETNQVLCQRLGLTQVVSIFRLMERVGNILGPIIAGLFIAIFEIPQAFFWLAALVAASTLTLGVWIFLAKDREVA